MLSDHRQGLWRWDWGMKVQVRGWEERDGGAPFSQMHRELWTLTGLGVLL